MLWNVVIKNWLGKALAALSLMLLLTSCFEMREEIYIHKKGHGKYVFVLDFSQSKPLIDHLRDSISELKSMNVGYLDDSLKKNPFADLEKSLLPLAGHFKASKGISKVSQISDSINYIFGVQCYFDDFNDLNKAISAKKDALPAFSFQKGKLTRSNQTNFFDLVEKMYGEKNENRRQINYISALFEKMTYCYTVTVSKKIKNHSNPAAVLSEDKTKLSQRVSFSQLQSGVYDLKNIIKFQ